MKNLEHFLEHFIEIFITNLALIIEIIGALIIAFTIIKVIYIFVSNSFSLKKKKRNIELNKGLAFALEILLASEILKTLIAKDLHNMLELGVLIVIRITMTLIIHWELTISKKHED